MTSRVRRRTKSAAARLRPFWMLFLLLAVLIGVGAYYGATWRGFYPKRITVSGNHIVPASQILERAEISKHANIWLQNTHAAAARVEAIPYIATASVHRLLPAGVRIAVTERAPFAILQAGGTRVLVDRDLRVLQDAGEDSALPVIIIKSYVGGRPGAFVRNADAVRLRNDYETLAEGHIAIRSLSYDRFGDLVAATTGGIKLLLGDDTDLAKKTPLVDPIISQVSASGKRLAAVDLRAPATPVVVYKQ
jgi:cell division septal protein FtsQ